MKALSLFSGIGGLDLAAEKAGISIRAFCENDPFAQTVLRRNFPGKEVYDDINVVPWKLLDKVDLIYGGPPCQPFSVSGNQKGEKDERYLWPAMLTGISVMRPTCIVVENVKGIISSGLDRILADLENQQYTSRTFCIPACAVGANHVRERIFVVSYATGDGRDARQRAGSDAAPDDNNKKRKKTSGVLERCCSIRTEMERNREEAWTRGAEPCIRAASNGLEERVAMLRSLGNAVVWQQAFPIFACVKSIYDGLDI